MNSLLTMNTPGTSRLQFLKLIALGIFQSSLWFPLSLAFTIVNIAKSHFLPYEGWGMVHKHFNTVKLIDPDLIPSEELVLMDLSRWMGPLTAICLFLFFGTKKDVWSSITDTCKHIVDRLTGTMDPYLSKFFSNRNSRTHETSEKLTTNTTHRAFDLESQKITSESLTRMPADCDEISASKSTVGSITESFDINSLEKVN